MGGCGPYSVSPPMGRLEMCSRKEYICGHHCLATAHIGAQETISSFQGLLTALGGMDRMLYHDPRSAAWWGLSLSPPHLGSTALVALCTPALCAFPPQGLCMCCTFCLAFSAPSLPHFFPMLSNFYSFRAWLALPFLRRESILAILYELAFSGHPRHGPLLPSCRL